MVMVWVSGLICVRVQVWGSMGALRREHTCFVCCCTHMLCRRSRAGFFGASGHCCQNWEQIWVQHVFRGQAQICTCFHYAVDGLG